MENLHDGRDTEEGATAGEIAGGASGAVAGGAIGAAVGGPIGAIIGAAAGAIAAAKAVDALSSGTEQTGTEVSAAASSGTIGSGSTGAIGAPLGATAQSAVSGVAMDQLNSEGPGTSGADVDTTASGFTTDVDDTRDSLPDLPAARVRPEGESSATADRNVGEA